MRTIYRAAGDKRSAEDVALFKRHPNLNITPGNLYQYISTSRAELKKFDDRMSVIRKQKPVEDFLRVLNEVPGRVPETFLFHRGDHKQPQHKVIPAALTVTAPEGRPYEIPVNDEQLPTTGRRLAYARWLTSGRHPLVVRVLVNRIWMHHFGRAIVATPGDFGVLGVRPTHPKLLDWLADEFVKQGWSLKKLHRMIMLSTVYRQSSTQTAGQADIDPENRFYGRKPIVRLEAEALRDRMLAAAGKLDRTLFGAPLAIKEDDAGQVIVSGEQKRRSLYIRVRRSRPVAMLQAFDAPVMETNCEIRSNSTVATQSLMMMNGQFILQQAATLAERARKNSPQRKPEQLASLPKLPQPPSSDDLPAQAANAWELALCRPPTSEELRLTVGFLAKQLAVLQQQADRLPKGVTPGQQALTNLCQVLLSSNEFLYVD
ncbi:MAG: DUF1553 domain-containing protein [Acidobacteria bacterium]|nr:DUF1553 domain-containing protein [Acidobacteriota bacterium]